MSARAELQQRLVDHLHEQDLASNVWTAPYGILDGLHHMKSGRGAVRTITFGVARYLDATIFIWSATKLTIDASGGLAYKVAGTFGSEEELIAHLDSVVEDIK